MALLYFRISVLAKYESNTTTINLIGKICKGYENKANTVIPNNPTFETHLKMICSSELLELKTTYNTSKRIQKPSIPFATKN